MFFRMNKSKQKVVLNLPERKIFLKKKVLNSILSYCKMKYPNEGILILRGKSKKSNILIDELVIPPFSFSAHSSSGFPHHMLPADLSYVGTVHSHPSGNGHPSVTDLNNFFELISLIVRYPFGENDIFAWNSNGVEVNLEII
ncbi:MAG: Mov34/MPN/PAD-1 family protein [Nitrosopumilaceae archaeon]